MNKIIPPVVVSVGLGLDFVVCTDVASVVVATEVFASVVTVVGSAVVVVGPEKKSHFQNWIG